MSFIEENNEIPEMYRLRHKHDTDSDDTGFDYSKNILKRTISPILYNNDDNELFLDKLNDMTLSMVETVLPVRNLFFYSHNKYFNKHGR